MAPVMDADSEAAADAAEVSLGIAEESAERESGLEHAANVKAAMATEERRMELRIFTFLCVEHDEDRTRCENGHEGDEPLQNGRHAGSIGPIGIDGATLGRRLSGYRAGFARSASRIGST